MIIVETELRNGVYEPVSAVRVAQKPRTRKVKLPPKATVGVTQAAPTAGPLPNQAAPIDDLMRGIGIGADMIKTIEEVFRAR